MMQSARYGRMRIGRCLKTSYYIGCRADVLPHMDRICSGKRSCVIKTVDSELLKYHPCRKDLMPYLEAQFKCITSKYELHLSSALRENRYIYNNYWYCWINHDVGIFPIEQECIPVRCVPATHWPYSLDLCFRGRGDSAFLGVCLLDEWGRTPGGQNPQYDHVTSDVFWEEADPQWTEWVTHTCENITFVRFATRVVKIKRLL